jgi:hypothetical protein
MRRGQFEARFQFVRPYRRALGNETVFEPGRLLVNHDADPGLTGYGNETAADTLFSQ